MTLISQYCELVICDAKGQKDRVTDSGGARRGHDPHPPSRTADGNEYP